MNDLLNPYIAGAPVVEPSMFFGREDVFNWIEQNLTGRFVNHILVIHGQRRVGKTSVIKQLPNHLPTHFIQIFFDLQGRTHTSIDRFQWWLAREICRAIHQARGLSIPIPERESFSQEPEYLVSSFLPEVLSQLDQSILLLTFDEFDTLSEPEIQDSLTRPLIAYLRRLFDLPKLNFIFSIGSSGHKLENMQASYTEFFKAALYRKISFLKQEDCARLITQPVEGVLQYNAPAVARIYAITSGHPYFTQLICHELFSLCQKTGSRAITRQDVDSVLEDVIERGTVNLKFVWDEATDLEKWVLASLAHELQMQGAAIRTQGLQKQPVCNEKQLSTALHNQHVRYSENDLNAALVHLREKDVLTQENHFVVELMCIWLLKNRPLDRVREELVQVNPIANRYNEIGEEFHALGQSDKALESFRQALATDPLNLRAQLGIANLHLEADDFIQAAEEYEKALRIDEDDIAARSGLCGALMALGEAADSTENLAEASRYYERVITVNPDHPEVHQRLARLYSGQAEAAMQAGEAEFALKNFAMAVEHAPEDQLLAERYAQVQQEHTKQLVAGLVEKFQQAREEQAWEVALDAIQRALQLAPNEPTLLKHLEAVKDAPRLAKIASLQQQAKELEQLERWAEAVQSWEACLQLQPADEGEVRQSLDYARQMQKVADAYTQAQVAIKADQYNQAIHLLQGIIAIDASYKDTAQLLVDCLNVRPRRKINIPAGWWRWLSIGVLGIAIVAGIVSQWSRINPAITGLFSPKTPATTQVTGLVPTSTAGETYNQSTLTPLSTPVPDPGFLEISTFTRAIQKFTTGKAPDYQDDFSSAILDDYWNSDTGAQKATLTEGFLRLNNEQVIGDGSLQMMNYILQVDLRLSELVDGWIDYTIRQTKSANGDYGTEYVLSINPFSSKYILRVKTDPSGDYTQRDSGLLDQIQVGRWYTLGIVVTGDELFIYWDDKLIRIMDIKLYGLGNHLGLDPTNEVSTSLDIDNWRIWDLGVFEWMTSDWITSQTPALYEDNFMLGDDWQFSPAENGGFANNHAILKALNSETGLSNNAIFSRDFALEVDFLPWKLSENCSLMLFLGKNISTGDMLVFEYFLQSGIWQIVRVYNQGSQWLPLYSGWVERISSDQQGIILIDLNQDILTLFINNKYLGSYQVDRTGHGTWNEVVLRENSPKDMAQLDITKIVYWDKSPFAQKRQELIGEQPPDTQEEFSGDTLPQLWQWGGNQANSLQDGTLRVGSWVGDPLQAMNYILQANLRFTHLSGSENLAYAFRCTGLPLGNGLEYTLSINLSLGEWNLSVITEPQDQGTPLQQGFIDPIQQGRWYELGVVLDNQNLWVFWDGIEIFSLENLQLYGVDNHFGLADNDSGNATLEVDNWRFWNLGTTTWMRNDWITQSMPTFSFDRFVAGTNWQFNPSENEKYINGKAVLYTDKDETFLTSQDIQGKNFALEATFIPGAFPDPASLVLTIGKNSNGDSLGFEFFPIFGKWQVYKVEDQQQAILSSGWFQPMEKETAGTILVLVDGDRVCAFLNNTFLGYANVDWSGLETTDVLSVRSNVALYTQVDIHQVRFWDLDSAQMMFYERIYLRSPLVDVDRFAAGEGWQFTPGNLENYQDGMAILSSSEGETSLTRETFGVYNLAAVVNFIPRDMPENASLGWLLRQNPTTKDRIIFEYFPANGMWQISEVENEIPNIIASGTSESVQQGSMGTLLVTANGEYVSGFINGTGLGPAQISLSGSGMNNELEIINHGGSRAQLDIARITFWNLGDPEWMSNHWIYERALKFVTENFLPNEGWQVSPNEDILFQGEGMKLYTHGGDTHVTRSDFSGNNIAMEVSFKPAEIGNSTGLIWNLGMGNTGGGFSFEYHPTSGEWMISEDINQASNILLSGVTQYTLQDQQISIMVVLNGNRLSAFNGTTFMGSVDLGHPPQGNENWFGIIDSQGNYGAVDIVKINFWNLDEPEWMSSYWITSQPTTYATDVFKAGDGWQFGPPENEKFEDNHAILTTDRGETEFTRSEIQGTDGALYVAFMPRDMPDTACLVWVMRENSNSGNLFSFEYFPATGNWQIIKVQDRSPEKIASGTAKVTANDALVDIMVAVLGDRLSVFMGNTFLASVESSLFDGGSNNWLVIRNDQSSFARVDLIKLVYWSFD